MQQGATPQIGAPGSGQLQYVPQQPPQGGLNLPQGGAVPVTHQVVPPQQQPGPQNGQHVGGLGQGLGQGAPQAFPPSSFQPLQFQPTRQSLSTGGQPQGLGGSTPLLSFGLPTRPSQPQGGNLFTGGGQPPPQTFIQQPQGGGMGAPPQPTQMERFAPAPQQQLPPQQGGLPAPQQGQFDPQTGQPLPPPVPNRQFSNLHAPQAPQNADTCTTIVSYLKTAAVVVFIFAVLAALFFALHYSGVLSLSIKNVGIMSAEVALYGMIAALGLGFILALVLGVAKWQQWNREQQQRAQQLNNQRRQQSV